MRYVLLMIGIITIVAGSYFNRYILPKIDIGMFGNSMPAITSTDSYQKYVDITFKENSKTLDDIDRLWNDVLANLMGAKVMENGQTINTIAGSDIDVEADVSNAWGSYKSEYSVVFQGYDENGLKYSPVMKVTPKDKAYDFVAPAVMKINQVYTSNSTNNQYLVLNLYPENYQKKVDGKQGEQRQAIVDGAVEAFKKTSKGSVKEFTVYAKSLTEILQDDRVGQAFQAALGLCFVERAYGSKVFTDNSLAYTFSGRETDLRSHGEMQWIYDTLRSRYKLSTDSAARLSYVMYNMYLIEQQSIDTDAHSTQYSAWEYGSDHPFWQDIWNSVVNAWRKLFSKEPTEQELKDTYLTYVQRTKKDKTSPILMFGDVYWRNSSSYNSALAVFNQYYSELQEYRKQIKDKSAVASVSNCKLDLDLLDLRMDLILTVYDQMYGLSTEGYKLTYNGKSLTSISSFLSDVGLTYDSSLCKKAVKKYKTGALNSGYMKDVGDIISTVNKNSNQARKLFEESFVNVLSSGGSATSLESVKAWKATSTLSTSEIEAGLKFRFSKALFDYAYKITNSNIKLSNFKIATYNGYEYPYVYPQMVAGEQLYDVLQQTAVDLRTGKNGKSFEVEDVIYVLIYNYDKIKVDNITNKKGISLKVNESLVSNRTDPSGIVQPVIIGAYAGVFEDGFDFTKCKWESVPGTWASDENYVNIWKMMYGDQSLAEITKFNGKINIDVNKWLTMYNNLSASKKAIQDEKAVNYVKLLEGYQGVEENGTQ